MTRITIINSLESAKAVAANPPVGCEPLIWNAGYVMMDKRIDPPTVNPFGDIVYTIRAKPPLAEVEDWRVVFMPVPPLAVHKPA